MLNVHVMTADGPTPIPGLNTTKAAEVWHYTDAFGLHGIVAKNELWASTPLTLNDTTEMQYGIDQIRRAWKRLQGSEVLAKAGTDRQAVVSQIISPDNGSIVASRTYLVCATEDKDSLNQWQGYARAQGYSIGFRTGPHLAPVAATEPAPFGAPSIVPGWFDVIYDESEQADLSREVLLFVLEHFTWIRMLSQATMTLTSLAARFKHPAFADEREVRFIAGLPESGQESFRPSSRGIVPHVRIKAAGDGQFFSAAENGDLLPIVGVNCAPADERDRPALKEAVERFLIAHGHDKAGVTFSEVPYRFV